MNMIIRGGSQKGKLRKWGNWHTVFFASNGALCSLNSLGASVCLGRGESPPSTEY